MPIIHNESFSESDPFQLRQYGCYDMEGGPEVVREDDCRDVARNVDLYVDVWPHGNPTPALDPEPEPAPAVEPSLARFVAYWTPERRARRVAEELGR